MVTSEIEQSRTAQTLKGIGRWLGPLGFALLWLWPDPQLAGQPLSPDQQRTAAILFWVACWWLTEAVPVGAASLLPAALLPLAGVLGARPAASAYMNDLLLLFIGAFVLALGLERWGLHRRFALGVLARVGSDPRRIVLGFMVAGACLSMWLNNTATSLMMLPIGAAVIDAVEGTDDAESGGAGRSRSPFALALLLGLAYSCSVGGVMTPVGTAPNQVYLGFAADLFGDREELSFAKWMLIWLPLLLLYLPLGWLLLTRVVLRVDSTSKAGAEEIAERQKALGPVRASEWRMGILFGLTVVLWITRADLELGAFTIPGWQDVWERWVGAGDLSNSTVAIAAAVLAFVVPAGSRDEPSAPLMDWPTAKGLPWEVLLLLGGGFCLAAGVRESGLDQVLGAAFGPTLDGLPPWMAVLGVVAAVTFLTEITSNTATTQVLLPVLFSAAVASGEMPERWMLPATAAASCAFMLPVATPPNAVVYSSGRVTIPEMARVGFGMNLLLILLITAVFELWGMRWLG